MIRMPRQISANPDVVAIPDRRRAHWPTAQAVPLNPTTDINSSTTTANGRSSNSGIPMSEIASTMAVSTNSGRNSNQATSPIRVVFTGSSVTRCADPSTPRRATTSARHPASASRTNRKVVPTRRATGRKPPNT